MNHFVTEFCIQSHIYLNIWSGLFKSWVYRPHIGQISILWFLWQLFVFYCFYYQPICPNVLFIIMLRFSFFSFHWMGTICRLSKLVDFVCIIYWLIVIFEVYCIGRKIHTRYINSLLSPDHEQWMTRHDEYDSLLSKPLWIIEEIVPFSDTFYLVYLIFAALFLFSWWNLFKFKGKKLEFGQLQKLYLSHFQTEHFSCQLIQNYPCYKFYSPVIPSLWWSTCLKHPPISQTTYPLE